jgi:hypothetical protein
MKSRERKRKGRKCRKRESWAKYDNAKKKEKK